MRTFTIIGAGHAGLQLGIGLLRQGHQVTLVSNRTPDQIRSGPILSSQSMYHLAVNQEREQGLQFWDETCPPLSGMHVRAGTKDGVMVDFQTRMPEGQAVDQRLKMPRWMEEFERLGGQLRIMDVGIAEAEQMARECDLLMIATGKGPLGQLFERDVDRSEFDTPQRSIALTYVHGMKPREDFCAININAHPGVGELVHFPGLTLSGPCDIINIECVVGGPMEHRWSDVKTPTDHLALTMDLIREFFPWEAHRFENVRLTDDQGVLYGRVTPTVRKPVATLPSGRAVLGLGDIHVLNDPMTGQGSNNASKGATLMLAAITDQGDRAFDRAWMERAAELNWESARWAARLTNTMLRQPPHLRDVMGACQSLPRLAQSLAAGFNDPCTLADWYFDEQGAQRKIEACAHEPALV